MENNSTLKNWYSVYLGIFLMLLIIAPKLTAILFVLFVPLAIVGVKKQFFKFSLKPISILFFSIYLFYLFYCLFTRHNDIALKYLEYKLSFILFPLLFSFVPKQKINIQFLIIGFLIACLYLIGFGLIHSVQLYQTTNLGITSFLVSYFSFTHHPSYASAYYFVALFLVWYAFKMKFNWMKIWLALPLSFLFILATGLCLSLAGMLFLIFALAVFVLILIYKKWGKLPAIILTFASPVILFFIIESNPYSRGEYEGAKKLAIEYFKDPKAFIEQKKYPMSGTESRLVMWTASSIAFKDFPFGVGTGNVDEVLTAYLNKLDQKELGKLQFNPHNQYLQTGIEIGWLGLFVLIATLFYCLFIAKKYSNWLLMILVCNLLFNMLFESMLQRQSGIMFYVFGICLLMMLSEYRFLDQKKIE